MKYFSYNPENGFELYKTAEEARKETEESLDYERSVASEDGWADYVPQLCWGKLKQRVIMTQCRPRDDGDTSVSPDCNRIVDYGLIDVS